MKVINYRGGIIRFRIPAHWEEEYEPDGGGTFYDASMEDTATLRVNVITIARPDGGSAESIEETMRNTTAPAGWSLRRLTNGNVLRHYLSDTEEAGVAITLVTWEVANPVPPGGVRLAVFTHTVLTSRMGETETQLEIARLQDEIIQTEFTKLTEAEIQKLISSQPTTWGDRVARWLSSRKP